MFLLSHETVFVLGDENVSKETLPIEYVMALEPFQVLLEYDDEFPMPKSDEMIVLTSTQYYLSTQLQASEPDFQRIVIYQYVRDYVMESNEHFSKIAMNGMVMFSSPVSEAFKSRVLNQIFKLLSANADRYVAVLREEGMDNVVNSTLLSIQGNEMTYQHGVMVEKTQPEATGGQDEDDLSRDMGEDMRKNVLLLCLLVPGIAIIAAAVVFLARMAREIKWSSPTQNDALWRSKEIRRGENRDDLTGERSNNTNERRRKFPDIEDLSDISSETGHSDT